MLSRSLVFLFCLAINNVASQDATCSCPDGSSPQPLCMDIDPCYIVAPGADCSTEGARPIAGMCIDSCAAPPEVCTIVPVTTPAPTTITAIVSTPSPTVAGVENVCACPDGEPARPMCIELGACYEVLTGEDCNLGGGPTNDMCPTTCGAPACNGDEAPDPLTQVDEPPAVDAPVRPGGGLRGGGRGGGGGGGGA